MLSGSVLSAWIRCRSVVVDSIRFNEPSDGRAIAALTGADFNPEVNISICRVRDGERLGGVIYTGYTEESICMHQASWTPRWANRDLLFVVFDYPFNQLGVKRIFGQVPEDNKQAMKLNLHLGFKIIARIEGVFKDNITCLVVRMERDECRFLRIKPRHIRSNVVR